MSHACPSAWVLGHRASRFRCAHPRETGKRYLMFAKHFNSTMFYKFEPFIFILCCFPRTNCSSSFSALAERRTTGSSSAGSEALCGMGRSVQPQGIAMVLVLLNLTNI